VGWCWVMIGFYFIASPLLLFLTVLFLTSIENNLKEQKGLEILDLKNLEEFVTKCINLTEDFKSQYIREDTNGLTILILQVGPSLCLIVNVCSH
jgi:hypothetical protein